MLFSAFISMTFCHLFCKIRAHILSHYELPHPFHFSHGALCIAKSYDCWGTECAMHLYGDFLFISAKPLALFICDILARQSTEK